MAAAAGGAPTGSPAAVAVSEFGFTAGAGSAVRADLPGAELRQRLLDGTETPRRLASERGGWAAASGAALVRRSSRSDLRDALRWLEGEEEQEEGGQAREVRAAGGPALPEQVCQGADVVPNGEADEEGRVPQQSEGQGQQVTPERAHGGRPSAFRRALLPSVLFAATLSAAASMLTLQRSLVRLLFGGCLRYTILVVPVYAVTVGCMFFVAFSNPGQLDDKAFGEWQAGGPLPRRAHKNWRVERPILRFDHYCRWAGNCVGLRNHREFLVMTAGLVAGALLGVAADVALGIALMGCLDVWPADAWVCCGLAAHLAYSAVVLRFATPILRLHVGFVSRNELTHEWKQDCYYVVRQPPLGEPIWVNDLAVADYNKYMDLDLFEYDSSRNPFDRGCRANCWLFWCTARRAPGELGEF